MDEKHLTTETGKPPGNGRPKKNNKKPKLTESARLIKMAGNLLQIGSIHAFVLHQVVETMRILNLDEIREMSKAIAPFERMARERRFRQTITHEIGERHWQANFYEIDEQEVNAEIREAVRG